MKILDKYILKKYLSTFLFVLAMLTLIVVVIDYTEKNDKFNGNNAPVEEIIFDYYLNFIPYMLNLVGPITAFITTILVTARMASHSEITAMLSGGISFKRMLVPFVIGAAIIGAVSFYISGWVIPEGNKIRVAFENKYTKREYFFDGRNIHLKIAPNTYAYLESYNNQSEQGYLFTLETIKDNRLLYKLSADKISWNAKDGKWHIFNYKVRTIADSTETIMLGEGIDTTLNLYPKDFDSQYGVESTLTLPALRDYIEELKDRGADNVFVYEIEQQMRYAYPFTIIMLTIIGVIVASRRSREGTGFKIALGFAMAFGYIIFFIMSRSIAQAGTISPTLAVWLPNLTFAVIGFIMYRAVPK